MNIGFYLNNKNISNINCSNILLGNLGIGGSEYSAIAISYLLSTRSNGLNIILYCNKDMLLPHGITYKINPTLQDSVEAAIADQIDYFVVDLKLVNIDIITRNKNLKFILWANNFASRKQLNFFHKQNNVVKIVNVGREQNDLWLDHSIYTKSTTIYNAMSFNNIKLTEQLPTNKRANNVVYIGSLVPAKGFYYLARAWKKVLEQVPDANLFVIGSGKLYNRNAILGKYGIAERSYEDSFIKYITDSEGKILPSIHFLGIMGTEKYDVCKKCKVGIPNPSGETETFGFTAIEMEMMGCYITTIKCPGYLDTVLSNNINILYDNVTQLASSIIRLLKYNKDDYNHNQTIQRLQENFSYDTVIKQWEYLFYHMNDGISYHINKNNYRLKNVKLFLFKLKKRYPFLTYIPSIEFLLSFTDKFYRKYIKLKLKHGK